MKCRNVRKEIERMAGQDNPEPGTEVYRHIDSCKACARYLEETRLVAGKIAGIRQMEPILKNPEELTEDIMKAIRENTEEYHFRITETYGKFPLVILQRSLAAAMVCLFLVFCYEEYVVVDKIFRLEKQNASISKSSQYQAALNLKKVMSILSADPEMHKHYKELISGKADLRILLRASMYIDMAAITPDVLRLLKRAGNNVVKPTFMSGLKPFDSTFYKIER